MATPGLPHISSLPTLSTEERAHVLDLLFEPCTQLHTLSVSELQNKTFSTYGDISSHVALQLKALLESDLESDQKWLEIILSAHPRLGEKAVESEMSKKEQAGLQGQGQDSEQEVEMLRHLNRQYEEKFPGLRYVTFVNNRPRPEIMADMQQRITSSNLRREKEDAIDAMCAIAVSRAHKLGAE